MNNMCYYTTTTRTPACRYHHPRPHPPQLRPYRPTQSGQHFPLFSRREDTRKPPPQLCERVDGPALTANEHKRTRVTPPPPNTPRAGLDYPHNTTPCPPPLSRHAAHAGTHARAQRSAVSLHAHFASTLGQPRSNRMTQTDRQTREEQER
eukprot:COSAG01_NODE_638_length_14605_cov_46.266097_2_plen_150_part_00